MRYSQWIRRCIILSDELGQGRRKERLRKCASLRSFYKKNSPRESKNCSSLNLFQISNHEYTLNIIFNQNTIVADRINSKEIAHDDCEFCNVSFQQIFYILKFLLICEIYVLSNRRIYFQDISYKIHTTVPLSVIHTVFQRMWRLPKRYYFNSVKFETVRYSVVVFSF